MSPSAVAVQFQPALPSQAEAISTLSLAIWEASYRPDLLSEGEFACFWNRAYTPERLRADMARGACYEWICVAGRRAGFLAYRHEPDGRRLLLGKLYLATEWHGQGIGARALARVLDAGRRLDVAEVYLYVFRRNLKAIRAYRRAGFVIDRPEVTPCEGGYRYDDYVMVHRFAGTRAA